MIKEIKGKNLKEEKLVRLKIILTSFKAISIFLLFLKISFRIN